MTTTHALDPTIATTDADASGEVALYRAEALRHRGEPDVGAPLLEAPRWVERLFWIMLAVVAAIGVAAVGIGAS
jgi:hypothetical protein